MVAEPRRDSRSAILAAATHEFTTYGFAGARVERIAKLAGVNKQLLFYYFGSKAGAFRAVLEQAADDAQAAVRERVIPAGMADGRLRAAMAGLVDTLVTHPQLVQLGTQRAPRGAAGDPLDLALLALAEPIRLVVLEGQGIGFFRDDVDPRFVARLALDLVLGHLAGDRGGGEVGAALRGWSQDAADLLVDALAW